MKEYPKGEWISIKARKFKDMDIVDIWSKSHGRLPNYRFRKNFAKTRGNDFFEPVESGWSCVRDATHWMLIPDAPKEEAKA